MNDSLYGGDYRRCYVCGVTSKEVVETPANGWKCKDAKLCEAWKAKLKRKTK